MDEYDIVLWGVENGKEARVPDPIKAHLSHVPILGNTIHHGDIPEINVLGPHYPLAVVGIGEPETSGSVATVHLKQQGPLAHYD
ncbi:hypothetical protein [Salinicola aestuarinus]|uniref:hypothetical protein n=1 Tax=Salinicola aestuarinus TaxID=1949082 RepID=UPI000DA1FD9E|nr:hypothetical protein [Salinicola aestuarinus]